MARSTRPVILNIDQEYIYFMGSETLPCASYPRSEYMVMWAVDRFKRYGRKSGRG